MEDITINNSSEAGAAGESSGAAPSGESSGATPPYVPHETDRGPDSGRTTRTIPTADVPNPELLGQYDRENVLSYAQGEQEPGYDFSGALQSVMTRPEGYAD